MFIQEIAAKKIIPPLKGVIVHRLKQHGYSQRQIADIFGVSQPQIHKYLRKTIDYYMDLLSTRWLSREEIDDLVELLVEIASKKDKLRFTMVASSIVDKLALKYFCKELKSKVSEEKLEYYCMMEKPIMDPYIEKYRLFISQIVTIRGLHKLIPEVGMNVAYAPSRPSSIREIIALPGRIIRMGYTPTAVGEPMYGGSHHVARILYEASKRNPMLRVAANIKYTVKIASLIKETTGYLECGPHGEGDFWRDIGRCLLGLSSNTRFIIDKGGKGLEPTIYILSVSLSELKQILEKLAAEAE